MAGVPSHFNFTTALDVSIFIAMGVLVTIVALCLLILTVAVFTRMRPEIASSLALAIRVGMLQLMAAQVLGGLIIATGIPLIVDDNESAVFGAEGVVVGAAGILKYPHGIALHAIQVLPLLAIIGLQTSWTEQGRYYTVATAALGYLLITTISTIQAYTGRGGLMLPWVEVIILLGGIVLLVGAGLTVLVAAVRKTIQRRM